MHCERVTGKRYGGRQPGAMVLPPGGICRRHSVASHIVRVGRVGGNISRQTGGEVLCHSATNAGIPPSIRIGVLKLPNEDMC